MPININTVIRRRDDIVATLVDNEFVMFDMDAGACFGLDPIASEIWQGLVEPTSVDELCAILLQRYNVTAETCQNDVLSLVEDLLGEGLLDVVAER